MANRLLNAAKKFFSRSMDAGAGGRRWDGAKAISNLNTTISAAGTTIRQRGAYYSRNNPWMTKGVNALVSNIIGTGIKPQSRHPDQATREKLHLLWGRWCDSADVAGMADFYALQSLVVRGLVESGEAFIRFRPQPLSDGPVPFKLQIIAPDQVDATLHRDLEGQRRIRSGIELDGDGRRLAYHILPGRPGDVLGVNYLPVRIPASDMLHVLEALEPGQVRGLSWLAPVLLRLHELDTYEDAQLVRQKVAALFAGFLVDPEGSGAGFEGTQTGGILETGLEPGTLKTLPPGYDVRFSEPAQVGDGADFVKTQLRAIAAGLGCTYEQLTGDLSGVNYSSIRAGLVEFRRRVDALRWSVVIPLLCRPVWERFIRTAVAAGRIPAAAFERDPDSFLAADWHPQGWDWVDPTKDVEAEIAAVNAGFKARSQVINDRGEDPEQVDSLIASDLARARQLGIPLPGSAPASSLPAGATPAPPVGVPDISSAGSAPAKPGSSPVPAGSDPAANANEGASHA